MSNPIRFSLDVSGETQFDRAFDRAGLVVSDLRPVWDEIKSEFHIIEREQFASEGASGASGKWKELSPKYEKIKSKLYPNKTILRRTDRLYKSLTSNTSDSIFESDKDEMAIGSNLPYAKYHQKGGKNLPIRKPISFSDNQKRRLAKRIQKSLLVEMRKTKLGVE